MDVSISPGRANLEVTNWCGGMEVGLSVYQSVQLVVPAATPLSVWCLLSTALGGMSSEIQCGKCGPDALIPTHSVVVVDPVRRRHLRQRWGRCTNWQLRTAKQLQEDFGAGPRLSEVGLFRKAIGPRPMRSRVARQLWARRSPISEDPNYLFFRGPLLHFFIVLNTHRHHL